MKGIATKLILVENGPGGYTAGIIARGSTFEVNIQ